MSKNDVNEMGHLPSSPRLVRIVSAAVSTSVAESREVRHGALTPWRAALGPP